MHFHPSRLPEVRAAGPIMPLLRLTTRFPQFFLHEKIREIKRIIQYLAEKAAKFLLSGSYRTGKRLIAIAIIAAIAKSLYNTCTVINLLTRL